MPWVKLDDLMPEHPKILGLSDRAFRAWVNALCYCNRQRTDGFVPKAAVPVISGTKATTGELVTAGLWEQSDGGYRVHDFLKYQPAKADGITTALSRARSEAGKRGAAARWRDGN